MFILYDLITWVFAIVYLPIYIFRRRFYQGFIARFGILPDNLKLEGPIWIHAVSVGEAMAIRGLLEELRKAYPGKKFVLSTVTPTGNKITQAIAKNGDFVTYLPLDIGFIVKKVIDKIRPSLFIIVETELWPNLISYLAKKKIPIAIVNGRISDHSFKGYLLLKFLLKPILNKINLFCVQANQDQERLIRLGVRQEKIQVSGNMKFDVTPPVLKVAKSNLKIKDEEQLFVCGSTHPGEEEIILGVYRKILSEFPNLRLLLAPRHPERANEVEKIVIKYGFHPQRISRLPEAAQPDSGETAVFILDTIGQLLFFYSIADIVFVGGSLVKKGGHNILEPAMLEKPILFGEHMFNFRDIAQLFLSQQAAIMVEGREGLEKSMKELLRHPAQALKLGQMAKELMFKNSGSLRRTLEPLKEIAR